MFIPKGTILRDDAGKPVFEALADIMPSTMIKAADLKSLNGEPIKPGHAMTVAQEQAVKNANPYFHQETQPWLGPKQT